jgi:hypothetical protein
MHNAQLSRYNLDFVGVQEVRWDKVHIVRAGDYIFCYGKGNKSSIWNRFFFVHHRKVLAFKRVELAHGRMSYIVL